MYASPDLFRRLWPKLLKASAIEAVAEQRHDKHDKKAAPLKIEAVRAAFASAERGRESSKQIGHRLDAVTRETDQAVLFETRDRGQGGAWIHRSYVIK